MHGLLGLRLDVLNLHSIGWIKSFAHYGNTSSLFGPVTAHRSTQHDRVNYSQPNSLVVLNVIINNKIMIGRGSALFEVVYRFNTLGRK